MYTVANHDDFLMYICFQGFDSSSTVESTHEKPKKKAKIEERKSHDGKHIITKIHIKPIEPPK